MDKVMSYLKSLKQNDYNFTIADILKKFPNADQKSLSQSLQKLVKNHKLSVAYQVYNSKDSSQSVIFKSKQDIPFGGYVDYKPTGDHFYVSKWSPNIDKIYAFNK